MAISKRAKAARDEMLRQSDGVYMNAGQLFKKRKFQMGRKPTNQSEWVHLGEAMIEWAKTSDSLYIEDFAIANNYSPYRLYRYKEDDEYYAECYDMAASIVGRRREEASRDRKQDNTLLVKKVELYDRVYKEVQAEKRKDAVAAKTIPAIIEIPVFDETDSVPKRKEEDEAL